MPPKFKFKREEIVEAAVNLTRRGGVDAVTARGIAGELGVSTQPIFTCFKNMEEAKEEVRIYAEKLCHNYLEKGVEASIPFFGFGMAYIRFAKEEPELYKMLFINPDKKGDQIWLIQSLHGITQNSTHLVDSQFTPDNRHPVAHLQLQSLCRHQFKSGTVNTRNVDTMQAAQL